MKLQLKFRNGTSAAQRSSVIARATRAGAVAVRPLFPEDTDGELASLYVVDVDTKKSHDTVRSLLSGEKHVEFIEAEVKRKLHQSTA
ncbi:MAG: hypothetical protein A3H35_15075 [Betaproteobacteria bacterium RIFCSPLOWO2_02_FULL_62_17]|nr:MAG: hypothetical protein A3H35_15075 [Betaproteobacteria bacterium RIFCSPLOWO2_02_FULL_62_17]